MFCDIKEEIDHYFEYNNINFDMNMFKYNCSRI